MYLFLKFSYFCNFQYFFWFFHHFYVKFLLDFSQNLIDCGLGMRLSVRIIWTRLNKYFMRKTTLKKIDVKFIVTLTFDLGGRGHVWQSGYPWNLRYMQQIQFICVIYRDIKNPEKSHLLLMTSLWRHMTSFFKTNFRNGLGRVSASKWYITRPGMLMCWCRSFCMSVLFWIWIRNAYYDLSQNLIDCVPHLVQRIAKV